MDVNNYKPTMHKDEIVACIAGTLYMALSKKIIINNKGKVGAIYNATNAIIDSKKMLTKIGTILIKWSDCDELLKAIKAIPAYNPP